MVGAHFELALVLGRPLDGADFLIVSRIPVGSGERDCDFQIGRLALPIDTQVELDAVTRVARGETHALREPGTFRGTRDFDSYAGPPVLDDFNADRPADVGSRRGMHLVPIHVP